MRTILMVLAMVLGLAVPVRAQTAVGGVAISAEGLVQMRTTGPVVRRPGQAGLTYVSLARVVEQMKAAAAEKKPLPAGLKTLQGMTRIEYVFVFPEERDLVIAGPSEPVRGENPLLPVGAITGRPVLQLDDLVVALRAVGGEGRGRAGRGRGPESVVIGCSLDLAPNAQQIAADIGRRFAGAPSSRIAAELKNALGPQQVRILGVPGDCRMALAIVAADYRLKRIAMGAESLVGVGNALSSGLASSRVWMEPAYDAVVTSEDGLSYQFTGPRLKVLAGAQEYDEKGATTAASAFARRFTERMNDAAGRIEALADLQNVTDLLLVATLVRQDDLARKTGVDLAWLMDAGNYQTAVTPVPRTAETIVHDSGTAIVEGGVRFASRALADVRRGKEEKVLLATVRARPGAEWFLTRPGR